MERNWERGKECMKKIIEKQEDGQDHKARNRGRKIDCNGQ